MRERWRVESETIISVVFCSKKVAVILAVVVFVSATIFFVCYWDNGHCDLLLMNQDTFHHTVIKNSNESSKDKKGKQYGKSVRKIQKGKTERKNSREKQ